MQLGPFTFRDMSGGMIRPYSISDVLTPPNSVSHAMNVNFDTVIGSAVVRPGTTRLGDQVEPTPGVPVPASDFPPTLGLTEFVTPNLTTNVIIGVFRDVGSTVVMYFWNGTSWSTSTLSISSSTGKMRFAQLGGWVFVITGNENVVLKSSNGPTTWGTTNCPTTTRGKLIFSTGQRLLMGNDSSTSRCRIWFSSIIDPTASPFITWNENSTTGDFIDVNPDDGAGDLTGFAQTSGVVLAFKNRAMYRVDAINKTVDTQNIFNFGAASQEAITTCQGIVYFFSGQDIRRTNGGYPEQISRLGVQEFIDAIPQVNWSSVTAGTDGFNVYFSIGDVTLNQNQDNEKTYYNVVLKFSPRDLTWSAHSYGNRFGPFCQFTNSDGRRMYSADYQGNVQALNVGQTDNGKAIFYELKTQDMEFGDLSHTKKISDKIVVFSQNGDGGHIQMIADSKDPKDVKVDLAEPVAVGKDIDLEGNKFYLFWSGSTTGQSPVFQGFSFPSVTDQGII